MTEDKSKQATLELGIKPVGKLLTQYAVPAILAMMASSLYNMVDSIFIGQGVGPLAIAGLAITFPFMNLSAAFGAAVGVGASTCMSVKLGQRDYGTARHILGNTITLNVLVGIVFGAISLLFLDPILHFFGASDETLPYARDYMVVILLGNVITHLYLGGNAVLRAASKPKTAMVLTLFTVVLNTVLDPIFIWGFGMGIRGAALATIITQTLGMLWQFKIFTDKRELLHMDWPSLRLRSDLVRNIVSIGISPFSLNVCACLVVILINSSLAQYGGDLSVGSYGIAHRIAFVAVMVVMGINQGMQPIAGYNYGARQLDRMMHVLKLSIIAATCVMTLAWVVGTFFPYYCARLFTSDPELIRLSERAIFINQLMFPIIGFQIVIGNFFQSIGRAKISIFLSLSRQMIILVPLLLVLPGFFGVDGIWMSLPASDFLATMITTVVMVRFLRELKAGKV